MAIVKRAVVCASVGPNVEVTGAARLYRAASVWTAELGNWRIGPSTENSSSFLPHQHAVL